MSLAKKISPRRSVSKKVNNNTVIVTKEKVSSKESLFAEKVSKMNNLLANAKLLK